MVPQWIIEKKRDGNALNAEEIRYFLSAYVSGEVAEYQMAALAMAIYFQGMSEEETSILTEAMMHSGNLVDTSAISRPKVDKHSTGGVGDKISLVLAPLAASCGLAVPMISGRGLGITGGTLDKLEAIPGYRCDLSESEFLRIVDSCGCSISGQTSNLAPADKKLYALRDVTGTVPSIPLITASILCKKLAEGIDALVLDVKVGRGAFMKTEANAELLARTMVNVGLRMGKSVEALITDMNQPLGRAVGNALEVKECLELLKGNGPEDLRELTLALGCRMLILGGVSTEEESARRMMIQKLENGEALECFQKMISLHGGDQRVVEEPERLGHAAHCIELCSEQTGVVHDIDPEAVGKACLLLGAGRTAVEDSIDHAVGISHLKKCGERVEKDEALLLIHANEEDKVAQAEELLRAGIEVSDKPYAPNLFRNKLQTVNS